MTPWPLLAVLLNLILRQFSHLFLINLLCEKKGQSAKAAFWRQ